MTDKIVDGFLAWQGEKLPLESVTPAPYILGHPPKRSPRLNVNVRQKEDTQYHEVVVKVRGLAFIDIVSEAEAINVTNEELCLHLLHNYRDNQHIWALEREYRIADQYLQEISGDFSRVVEHLLIEAKPESADDIQEQMKALRTKKKKTK